MLSEADRARVAQAVAAAEAQSDGEIVTVLSAESDRYHDVVLHWTVLLMLLGLALVAWRPLPFLALVDRVAGGWGGTSAGEIAAGLLLLAALLFLVGRFLFAVPALKRLLTPGATKTRRVRRRAVLLFRLAAENRTRAKTGVLLYLSLAERRAELVADSAINTRVTPETWGEAMHALVDAVRDGRPGDGMVEAVERIGAVLAEHFPRSPDDTNELPDRLILL
jgi:putative membrane protein